MSNSYGIFIKTKDGDTFIHSSYKTYEELKKAVLTTDLLDEILTDGNRIDIVEIPESEYKESKDGK